MPVCHSLINKSFRTLSLSSVEAFRDAIKLNCLYGIAKLVVKAI